MGASSEPPNKDTSKSQSEAVHCFMKDTHCTGSSHWRRNTWFYWRVALGSQGGGVNVTAWDLCLLTPELVPFKQQPLTRDDRRMSRLPQTGSCLQSHPRSLSWQGDTAVLGERKGEECHMGFTSHPEFRATAQSQTSEQSARRGTEILTNTEVWVCRPSCIIQTSDSGGLSTCCSITQLTPILQLSSSKRPVTHSAR